MNPGVASAQLVNGQVYRHSIAVGIPLWSPIRLQIGRRRIGEHGLDALTEIGALAFFAALQRSSLHP